MSSNDGFRCRRAGAIAVRLADLTVLFHSSGYTFHLTRKCEPEFLPYARSSPQFLLVVFAGKILPEIHEMHETFCPAHRFLRDLFNVAISRCKDFDTQIACNPFPFFFS